MKMGDITGHKADPRDFPKGALLHYTLFGVEVEVENSILPIRDLVSKYWSIKEDGSLRSEQGRFSMEFTFCMPMGGKHAERAIDELSTIYQQIQPQNSERCGTHIHMDVRDLEEEEYIRFVAASILVEPLLFHLFSSERENNAFCLPRYCLVNEDKYRGINIEATNKYGSVEFRMFRHTKDPRQLLTIMQMLEGLKERSKELTYDDINEEGAAGLLGIQPEEIPQAARLRMASAACAAVLKLKELGNAPKKRKAFVAPAPAAFVGIV